MSVGNVLIGLREGIEASLVISILTAFLVRAGRSGWVRQVRIGLLVALLGSVAVGALLIGSRSVLGESGQDIFAAVTSAVALVFVTGMVFWMRHPPEAEGRELTGKLARVLRMGPGAVLTISFLAVVREGIEATTFVFLGSQQNHGDLLGSLLSLLAGVAVAVVLTRMLYLGAVRVNLTVFFTITGFLLIFFAAGVFGDGVRALQDAGVLGGDHTIAFDLGSVLPDNTWYGTLLGGLLNMSARPTVLQATAWAGYWGITTTLFLFATTRGRRPATALAATD